MADGPLIVSSDRFKDIEPYWRRLYAAEPQKWGDVFPWEFPQNGSRQDEEAFLREHFSDDEIFMQGGASGEGLGFKFLKQVWYSIAFYNKDHRVPAVAEWYMQNNQNVLSDPEMLKFVFMEDQPVSTFFGADEEKMYGEKLLKWVVKNIQYRVRQSKVEQEAEQRTSKAAGVAVTSPPQAVDTDSVSTSPDIIIKLQAEKPVLANVTDVQRIESAHTPTIVHSVPGNGRVERFPDLDSIASQPPASIRTHKGADPGHVTQQQRPRGNSNGKRYNSNNNNGGSMRFRQQNQAYYNSPYGASPTFATASPTIGSVPIYATASQMRIPSGGPPAVPLPLHPDQHMQHMQHMQGGPPHPVAFAHGMQHSFGPPYPGPPQPTMAPGPPGFMAPAQTNPAYNGYALVDRSNERFESRSFSDQSQLQYAEERNSKRGGYRRDSTASRGGKSRGYSNGGRGRGSRNSFSFVNESRPERDMFSHDGQFMNDARKQSGEYDFPPNPHTHNRDRRGSAMSQNWRSKGEDQQTENAFPDRFFSGSNYGPPPPMPDTTGTATSQLVDHFAKKPYALHHRRTSNAQSWYAPHETPTVDVVHDPTHPQAKAFPERLLHKTYIGMECSHVKKLIMFDVPSSVGPAAIESLLGNCGRITYIHSAHDKNTPDLQVVYVSFDSHIAARKAVQNHQQIALGGSTVRIEVLREYWDPKHARYHRFMPPLVPRPAQAGAPPSLQSQSVWDDPGTKRGRNDSQSSHPSGDSTPTAKAPTSAKAHKQHFSGDSTPTESRPNTPKKAARKNKNKNKNQNQKQQQSDVRIEEQSNTRIERQLNTRAEQQLNTRAGQRSDIRADALQHAAVRRERAESVESNADAKSDASACTVIIVDGAQKDSAISSPKKEESGEVSSASALTVDTQRKLSDQSDNAETKSAPPISPEALFKPEFAKVKMPQSKSAPEAEEGPRQFRVEGEFEGKAASSEAVTSGSEAANESAASDEGAKASDEPTSGANVKTGKAAQLDASESPQKLDEDQADDGFHTANGSPDSQKDGFKEEHRNGEGSAAAERDSATVTALLTSVEEVKTPTKKDAQPAEKTAAEIQVPTKTDYQPAAKDVVAQQSGAETHEASSYSPSSGKAVKKAPVPHVHKVKITEPPSSAPKSGSDSIDADQNMQTSSSGLSVPPTPSFQTAPSTPLLPTDTIHANDVSTTPPQPKKEEKSKGPAQTESLSLFAKKQKPKKSKPAKGKASMRGKPNVDEAPISNPASAGTSRAVSGAATPTMQSFERPAGRETSQNTGLDGAADEERTNSKAPLPAVEKKITDTTHHADAIADDPSVAPVSHATSPSKPHSMLEMVSSYFGRTQHSTSATLGTSTGGSSGPITSASIQRPQTDQQVEEVAPQQDNANGDKAAGESEDRPVAPVAHMLPRAEDTGSAGAFKQPFPAFPSPDGDAGFRDSGDSGGDAGHRADGDVGLGISTVARTAAVTEQAKPKKKKKKAGGKKKNKKHPEETAEEADTVRPTPEPEDLASTLQSTASPAFAFEFKANSQPSPPDAIAHTPSNTQSLVSDAASEASSHTLDWPSASSEQTPTSASASASNSPTMREKLIKKFGSDHLIKAPTLRRKGTMKAARATSSKGSETTTPPEDDKKRLILGKAESDDEGAGDQFDKMMGKMNERQPNRKPPMLYLYVGHRMRSDDAAEWQAQGSGKVEGRVEEVVESTTDGKGNEENVKPESAGGEMRKGG